MFTCGSSLEDLALSDPLNDVHVRSMVCSESIEKLYYSAGYDPVYINCASAIDMGADSQFNYTVH